MALARCFEEETRLASMSVAVPSLPLDPLIGRVAELAAVQDALSTSRLVTLTGLGGTGKTRLAWEVLRAVSEGGADAHFVDLVSVTDPTDLPGAVASVLGVGESAGIDLATAIADELTRRRLLLVLDNVEQLVAARGFIAALLERAPPLRILATSRIRLGVRGEREIPLDPLAVPDSVEALEASGAGVLFLRRAREHGSLGELRRSDAEAIFAICRRLDGLPLAIELAAAWTRILSPQAIMRRLEESRLSMVDERATRHASLDVVVEATLGLVDATHRTAFDALSVFAGWFDEPAAAAVTGIDDVLTVLRRLEEVALIRRAGDQDGEPRFGFLQTIRAVAAARLAARGDQDTVRRAHAEYCLSWIEPRLEALRRSASASDRFAVELETGNLRVANSYAMEIGDVDLALRVATAMAVLGRRSQGALREHAERLAHALAAPSASPRARCEGLTALAWLTLDISRDGSEVENETREAVQLARALQDPLLLSRSLIAHATIAAPPDAIDLFEEAADVATRNGLPWEAASAYNNAADALGYHGRLDEAHVSSVKAIELSSASGDRFGQALALMNAGEIDLNLGRVEAAQERLVAAADGFRVASSGTHLGRALSILACAESVAGRQTEAYRHLDEAADIVAASEARAAIVDFLADAVTVLRGTYRAVAARALGAVGRAQEHTIMLLGQPLLEAAAATLDQALGEARYEQARRSGYEAEPRVVFEEIRAILKKMLDTEPQAAEARLRGTYGQFTRREEEVLGLLAEGRSDGDIATELYISPKTASVHVTNIKAKLGVETRVEAALLARGLIHQATHGDGETHR